MERLHDILGHPQKLIIRWGQRRALCHKVAIGLYGVAETEWERCWGAPDEVFRREWLPSCKLRRDIGEQKGEVA